MHIILLSVNKVLPCILVTKIRQYGRCNSQSAGVDPGFLRRGAPLRNDITDSEIKKL